MLSKSTIKYVRSLRQQKYRQKYHKIVVEGVKSVHDLLASGLTGIETIFAGNTWQEELPSDRVFTVERVEDHELASISSFTTPQQVLAVCEMPEYQVNPRQVLNTLCLYLDGVRDPGNVGAIFRIADWFGIRTIFLSPDCADPYNPKVIQASMGSIFRVEWAEYVLEEILNVEGVKAFVTLKDGADIYAHPLAENGVIIMGNESTGVRNITARPDLQHISIPGQFRLGADSLNVAVATGIICAEFRRRASVVGNLQ